MDYLGLSISTDITRRLCGHSREMGALAGKARIDAHQHGAEEGSNDPRGFQRLRQRIDQVG